MNRKVSFQTFEDDGCWWAHIIQHGRPVPEGSMPHLAQVMRWSGRTESEAVAQAKKFLSDAIGAVMPN